MLVIIPRRSIKMIIKITYIQNNELVKTTLFLMVFPIAERDYLNCGIVIKFRDKNQITTREFF